MNNFAVRVGESTKLQKVGKIHRYFERRDRLGQLVH